MPRVNETNALALFRRGVGGVGCLSPSGDLSFCFLALLVLRPYGQGNCPQALPRHCGQPYGSLPMPTLENFSALWICGQLHDVHLTTEPQLQSPLNFLIFNFWFLSFRFSGIRKLGFFKKIHFSIF